MLLVPCAAGLGFRRCHVVESIMILRSSESKQALDRSPFDRRMRVWAAEGQIGP
jgi:hypothetical protein